MNFKGAWNSSDTYLPGTVRFYNGNFYKCIATHTNSQPPSNRWLLASDWMDNTQSFTAAVTLLAGDPIAVDSNGKIIKSINNSTAIGIATINMAVDDTAPVVICGLIELNGWNFTPDLPVYVTTSGALTQTPPTDALREIGVAVQSNAIVVNPQKTVVLS
jgi:hypothetical protein